MGDNQSLKQRIINTYSKPTRYPETRNRQERLIAEILSALHLGNSIFGLNELKKINQGLTPSEGSSSWRIRYLRSEGFSLDAALFLSNTPEIIEIESITKSWSYGEYVQNARRRFVDLTRQAEVYLIPHALAEHFEKTPLPELTGSSFKVPSKVTLLRLNKPLFFRGYKGIERELEGIIVGKPKDTSVIIDYAGLDSENAFCVYCLYSGRDPLPRAIPENICFNTQEVENMLAGRIGIEAATFTECTSQGKKVGSVDAETLAAYSRVCRLGINALIFMNSKNVSIVQSPDEEHRFRIDSNHSTRTAPEMESVEDSDHCLRVQYLADPHSQRYHLGTNGQGEVVWRYKWFNRRGPPTAEWKDPLERVRGQELADCGMPPDNW